MENFLRHMIVSPDRGGSMARDLENSILPGPVDFLDGKFELVTVGRCLGLLASSDLLSNRTSWKTVSSELLALRVGLVGKIRKDCAVQLDWHDQSRFCMAWHLDWHLAS